MAWEAMCTTPTTRSSGRRTTCTPRARRGTTGSRSSNYNPVPEYVDAVMRYARQMTRDPRTFYAYYNWQVFVLTKHGDLRLTGPGL